MALISICPRAVAEVCPWSGGFHGWAVFLCALADLARFLQVSLTNISLVVLTVLFRVDTITVLTVEVNGGKLAPFVL